MRKPFAWFVFQLNSDGGSAKILGRQTSDGKDDFNKFMIKSLYREEFDKIVDQRLSSHTEVVLEQPFVYQHDRAFPNSVIVSNIHQKQTQEDSWQSNTIDF